MRIRATNTKGADPRQQPCRGVWCLPGLQRGRHLDGQRLPFDQRIRCLKMEMGRQLAMLQRQHQLDKAHNPRRGFQVAYIGLDRANQQGVCAVGPIDCTQGAQFNRVTQGGAGAVRFDIADFSRGNMRGGKGLV